MTQFITQQDINEAGKTLSSYLRREYRENQVEQGLPDPFPQDEPLQIQEAEIGSLFLNETRYRGTEPNRLRWLASVEAKGRTEHSVVNFADRRDFSRLEMKHGPQRLHILEIGACVPVGKKFARCGYDPFTDNVDISRMWSSTREAILNWDDVIAYQLTPRGRAVKIVMEPAFTPEEHANIISMVGHSVKLNVIVVGTLTEPMNAMLPSGWEDPSVYTLRAIEAHNQPDEYGINEPDTSSLQVYT